MNRNPFRETDRKTGDSSSIYAKGDHIVITEDEFLWQVNVFELDGSSDPEKDAYFEKVFDRSDEINEQSTWYDVQKKLEQDLIRAENIRIVQ